MDYDHRFIRRIYKLLAEAGAPCLPPSGAKLRRMSVTTSGGEPHGAVTVSVNDGQGSLIDILYDADGRAVITSAWVSFRGAARACDHDELTRAVRTLLRSRGLLPQRKDKTA